MHDYLSAAVLRQDRLWYRYGSEESRCACGVAIRSMLAFRPPGARAAPCPDQSRCHGCMNVTPRFMTATGTDGGMLELQSSKDGMLQLVFC